VHRQNSLFWVHTKGDVIAFRNPDCTLLKIIASVLSEGDAVLVMGTQPESIDSRRFGPVSQQAIMGKVIWHIKKPHR
jgi:hypothetical protein